MTIWHKTLEERFALFPVHQQILMICNELNRAENLRIHPGEFKQCLERSLELTDYFIRDKKGFLLKESLKVRDLIAEAYLLPPKPVKMIQRIFLQMNPTAWAMLNKT